MKKESTLKTIKTLEKVKISNNKKNKTVTARVDTGAKMSSMDLELAEFLGFTDLIKNFYKKDLSNYKPDSKNKHKIEREIFKKFSNEIPDLKGVSVVFSSSGITIRPIIEITLKLSRDEFKSRINLANRSKMKYPMIIGRRDLKNFLVAV